MMNTQRLLLSVVLMSCNATVHAADGKGKEIVETQPPMKRMVSPSTMRSIVFRYAALGELDNVRFYIPGDKPEGKCPVDWCDEKGRTALWYAAQNGHVNVVKHLLIHGAKSNSADFQSMTPRGIAALNNHAEVIGLFDKADKADAADAADARRWWCVIT